MHQGSPLLPLCRTLSRSLNRHPLCCPRRSSRHLFNQTSVYPVLALHSTCIRLLYQLSICTSSFLTLFIRNTPNKLLEDFTQEHSLAFSQHFSCPMPLLRTTPLVQLLLHIDTSSHLSPILYCSAHFSELHTLNTPHAQ